MSLPKASISCDANICTAQVTCPVPVTPDAGVILSDAGTIPDAGFPDGGVVVVADGGQFGLYDPPSTATSPAGEQLRVAALPLPAPGSQVCDPSFPNVCATRLLQFGHNEYSQLKALSDDSQFVLLYAADGNHHVYRYPSMVDLNISTSITGNWDAPRWRNGTHQIVYYLGTPARVMLYNVDTGATTTAYTSPYQFLNGSPVWEQDSDDGQWIGAYFYPDNLPAHAGSTRIIAAVNVSTGQLGATLPVHALYSTVCTPSPQYGELEPDFIAITPSGRYLAVNWNSPGPGRCQGMELFDIQSGAFVRQIHQDDPHGDWGVDPASGREFYMTSVLASPLNGNWPSFQVQYLDGLTPTLTWPRLYAWDTVGSAFDHVSCLGRGVSYCLVTAGGEYQGGPWLPGIGEIYLIYLNGAQERLIHHRSSERGTATMDAYWALPKAALSHDGKTAIYTSDWGTAGAISPYAITIPVGSGVKAAKKPFKRGTPGHGKLPATHHKDRGRHLKKP